MSSQIKLEIANPKQGPPVTVVYEGAFCSLGPGAERRVPGLPRDGSGARFGMLWDSVPRVSSLTAVFPFGCQVPQSGTLKLSHLREGTYTVQLTVMDTAGQRSSDNVSVTVLPMAFSAGGEKKVLPRHSRRPTESRPLAEGWDWTGLRCSDCAFHWLFPFYFWLLSNDDKNRLYCTWG